MRHPPDVPQLQKDPPAPLMDCVCNEPPTRHLLLAVDARRERIALALRGNLRSFGHDECGACALRIVSGIRGIGNVTGLGAARTRHRRHDDAMIDTVPCEFGGSEKVYVVHDDLAHGGLTWSNFD
jgi:hypothetical protein